MTSTPSKRLYLRNLPEHVGPKDLLKHFSSYGKVVEVKFVSDYAFVQFEFEEEAQDVLDTFQRQPFLGQDIVIEFAHPLRKDFLNNDDRRIPVVSDLRSSKSLSAHRDRHRRRSPSPHHDVHCRYPIFVSDIPGHIAWQVGIAICSKVPHSNFLQELKDFGRSSGGAVAYCNLDKKRKGRGFIEYFSRTEAERAVRDLDGKRLGGKRVRVSDKPWILDDEQTRPRSRERREHKSQRRSCSPDFRRVRSTPAYTDPRADDYYNRRSPPPAYHPGLQASYHSGQQSSSIFFGHAPDNRNPDVLQDCYPEPIGEYGRGYGLRGCRDDDYY